MARSVGLASRGRRHSRRDTMAVSMSVSRRNPVASGAAIGILVLVLAGTYALLQLPDPERSFVSASDNGARLEGAWSPSTPPRVEPSPRSGAFTAVRGTPYTVIAPAPVLGRPYTLSVAVPKDVSLKEATLYWEDLTLGAWRAVPSVSVENAWFLETVLDTLPARTWAVGVAYKPTPSAQALSALRSLVAVPPPGAIGYRAVYLSSAVPDDYVVAQDPFGSGGCDGRFQSGTEQTKTSVDATASERVVVRWELADGCLPGVVISPVVRDPS
jgi:hypothetical protein